MKGIGFILILAGIFLTGIWYGEYPLLIVVLMSIGFVFMLPGREVYSDSSSRKEFDKRTYNRAVTRYANHQAAAIVREVIESGSITEEDLEEAIEAILEIEVNNI